MGRTFQIAAFLVAGAMTMSHADVRDQVEHGYAVNDGVRIHYTAMGEGPLVVMIHGFPDFWYSWRHQMEALAPHFRVVAMDQRGYNFSDQPSGEESYGMRHLTADVAAVIEEQGRDSAVVAGHDWGGMVAWQFAFNYPQMVEQLIILNLPHPNGLGREMVINPEQRAGSDYAFRFQQGTPEDPDIFFGAPMNSQTLSAWVTDPDAREHYIEAFERSDFSAMLAYYKRNYPALPPAADTVEEPVTAVPALEMPVLMFHGLEDNALHSDGLNNTWDWINADMTLVTVPGASHFVQQDAAELVSETMKWWLLARQPTAARGPSE